MRFGNKNSNTRPGKTSVQASIVDSGRLTAVYTLLDVASNVEQHLMACRGTWAANPHPYLSTDDEKQKQN